MADIILGVVLVAILGSAVFYIYRAKKSGKKCIGCPDGCSKEKCSGCCGCGNSEK